MKFWGNSRAHRLDNFLMSVIIGTITVTMRKQMAKVRVTQKVIAKMAGVSVNTVSRALNNKPDVNAETKHRILKIVKEMGYTPNLVARSLKTGETRTIGVIVSDITNPFFSLVIHGIEDKVQKKGYSIILCNANENYVREEKAMKLLVQKRVDGILVTPVEKKTRDIFYLQEMKVPFVLVARHLKIPDLSYVVADDVLGGFLATEHLIKKGHRKIMYVAGPSHVTTVQERLNGYKKALAQYGIRFEEELVRFTNAKSEDGYRVMKDVLSKRLDFTAIGVFNDYLALGMMKAVRERGLRIPDDVAIVGYDDIEFASLAVVPLSSVRIPKYELGYKAAEILLNQLSKKHIRSEPQQIAIEPKLVIRSST